MGSPLAELPEAARLSGARSRFGLPAAIEVPSAPLAGDAGARRYYRVASKSGATVLLVLYPEALSAAQTNWAAIRGALDRAALRVPALYDDAPDLGAALVEDLGDRDLSAELVEAPREARPRLLDEAEDLLLAVRAMDRAAATRNAPFDAAFFGRELDHTRHWALEAGGRAPLAPGRAADWNALASSLARAAADPASTGDPVPTHRDFHANNLMRAPDGRLAPIDFQDLRLGPPDYDPVSLRFERAGESVESEASSYCEAVLLERAWKVLGTFEKMLSFGRTVYRPHQERAVRVIRRHTRPGSSWAGLLAFLPAPGGV